MRIAFDGTSSSASASDIGSDWEVLSDSEVERGMANGEGSRMPSSTQGAEQVQRRRTSNLDKVTLAKRQVSSSSRFQRAGTPKWMRESTPTFGQGDETADGPEQSGMTTLLQTSDESDIDSEEEQWPVAPRRLSNSRRRIARETSIEAQELSQRIRLSNEADGYVPRRSSLIVRRRSASRQSPAPPALSAPSAAKKKEVKQSELAIVEDSLMNLRIKRDAEERKAHESFEARNKALWTSIESSIREAEQARVKAEQIAAEKRRREEEERQAAERRAREAREDEEKRAKEAKEAEEKVKREQAAKQKAEEEARVARETAEAKEKTLSSSVGDGLIHSARDEYEQWWSKIQSIKTNILPAVSQNPEWRKQCFMAKRTITRNVGQLTNSRAEIVRITNSINDILTQARGASSAGGEIYIWILNHLSKCLIRQAEQEVAAKQDTAFPLARVVVWLMLEGHSELGDVLMARLTKKCCWCTAYCPPKKPDQNEAGYAKVLGKAGTDEPTLQYTSRMSGIAAMYFAICQTKPSAPPSSKPLDKTLIPTSFRPGSLWVWQARMISPRMMDYAMTPALFSVLIEIAGPSLLAAFGKQQRKVWTLLREDGLRQAKAGFAKVQSANSARVRLELLLDDWTKSGRVEGATQGREMDG